MGKHAGAYRSDKRRKELTRQKKQDVKRLKRFNKDPEPELTAPETAPQEGEGQENASSESEEQPEQPS